MDTQVLRTRLSRWKENRLDKIDRRKQWVDHLGNSAMIFPRDVAFPARQPVHGLTEYCETLSNNANRNNCYASLYPKDFIEESKYDRFYVDFDAPINFEDDMSMKEKEQHFDEQITDVYWEVTKLAWHLNEEYEYKPRVYFSGSRGFAVYLDFPVTKVSDFGAVVKAGKQIMQDASVNMDYVDEKVFESNRISRIPYTINFKNLSRDFEPLMCIPIDVDNDTDEVLHEIKNIERQHEVVINRSEEIAKRVSEVDVDGDYEIKENRGSIDIDVEDDPDRALRDAGEILDIAEHIHDGRKRIMYTRLVPLLVEAGFNRSMIHRYCKKFINSSGKSYADYRDYVEKTISRTLEGPDEDSVWRTWTWESFLMENDDIRKMLDKEKWNEND